MNYAVVITDQVRQCVEALPDESKMICSSAHKVLSEDPYRGHAIIGKFEGLRRFKAGPFRLIYEIDEKNKTVTTVMMTSQNGNR